MTDADWWRVWCKAQRVRLARWRQQMTLCGSGSQAGWGGLHRIAGNTTRVPCPMRFTWRTRDATLGPSVHVVGLGLTPREYGGHHVGTHER
jgi:hypothetical protein